MLLNSLDAYFKYGAQSKTDKSILRPSCTLNTYLYERYCFSSTLGSACFLYTPTTHGSKYSTVISTVRKYGLFCLCFGNTVQILTECTVDHVTAPLHKVEKQIVEVTEAGVCAFCWYWVIKGEYLVWDTWEIMGSSGFPASRAEAVPHICCYMQAPRLGNRKGGCWQMLNLQREASAVCALFWGLR